MSDTLAVVGLGHVGLVTAACLAAGNDVVGIDVDPARVEDVRAGRCPFHEEGLADALRDAAPRLRATTDASEVRGAGVVLLCVPTPPQDDGSADLRFVDAAVIALAPHLDADAVLVVRSTVPPGTGVRVEALLREAGRTDVAVVSTPEFLAEGTAVRDLVEAARLVVGGEDPARERVVRAFLRGTNPREVVRTDRATAELAKYAANTFLAARVSLVNEFARLCSATGADVVDLARVVGLDPRVGPGFLGAGLGYGGSCFPKDLPAVSAVGKRLGVATPVTRAVDEVNRGQVEWALGRIRRLAPGARRVALWGLSFKPGTDDARESPALRLAAALAGTGAEVACHDPEARPPLPAGCRQVDDPLEALEGAEVLVHATEWPQYRDVDPAEAVPRMAAARLFDGRNRLDLEAWSSAGATVDAVGRRVP